MFWTSIKSWWFVSLRLSRSFLCRWFLALGPVSKVLTGLILLHGSTQVFYKAVPFFGGDFQSVKQKTTGRRYGGVFWKDFGCDEERDQQHENNKDLSAKGAQPFSIDFSNWTKSELWFIDRQQEDLREFLFSTKNIEWCAYKVDPIFDLKHHHFWNSWLTLSCFILNDHPDDDSSVSGFRSHHQLNTVVQNKSNCTEICSWKIDGKPVLN